MLIPHVPSENRYLFDKFSAMLQFSQELLGLLQPWHKIDLGPFQGVWSFFLYCIKSEVLSVYCIHFIAINIIGVICAWSRVSLELFMKSSDYLNDIKKLLEGYFYVQM